MSIKLDPYALSWGDESLLRRPPQEDSRRHRTGNAQDPSCTPLRREPLLGQALRQDRPSGRPSHTQKEPRTAPQSGRESSSAPRGEDVKERPGATIGQRRRFLEHITGTTLSDSTVRRLMKRMGYSQKTDGGGAGTRRMAKECLEGDGGWHPRCSLCGVCG